MRRTHYGRRLCGENGPCLLKQAICQAQRDAAPRRDGRGRRDHRERDPSPRQRLVRRHGDMRAIKRENDINEQLNSQTTNHPSQTKAQRGPRTSGPPAYIRHPATPDPYQTCPVKPGRCTAAAPQPSQPDGGPYARRAMAQCAVRAFGLLDVHEPLCTERPSRRVPWRTQQPRLRDRMQPPYDIPADGGADTRRRMAQCTRCT